MFLFFFFNKLCTEVVMHKVTYKYLLKKDWLKQSTSCNRPKLPTPSGDVYILLLLFRLFLLLH